MNQSNPLTFSTAYLPDWEALLVRVDLSAYLIDYYLHRKEVAASMTAEQDEKLKDLIACFAIHLAAHSAAQSHAWTLHMVASPPYSLFVTGSLQPIDSSSSSGYLVGNVLTDSVRHTDVNSLHAQFSERGGEVFRSYVQSESSDVAKIVEHFYGQSEQNALRLHLSRTSDTATGLVALPGCDPSWLASVDLELLESDANVQKKAMRSGSMSFSCDCSPEKLLPFFRSLPEEKVEELYDGDDELIINCPRCGRSFAVGRAAVEDEA